IPGNDDAIRAIQLYTRAVADAVLEGKAAAPAAAADSDELVELDADGNPVAKVDAPRPPRRNANHKPGNKKPAPRAAKPAPAASDKPAAATPPATAEGAAEPAATPASDTTAA
ncbi:MAG TPA: hypothetical protein VF271_07990, partial [Rhodanobacteraceae bacterium]